jgi:hypothetical protein
MEYANKVNVCEWAAFIYNRSAVHIKHIHYIYIDFYVQILSTGIKLKFNISKKNIFPTRNILE